jgi:hypothetical protein
MAASWSVLEAYRENGRTHRELVEYGLTEAEAREMASEHNQMLRWVGVVEHWVEAVPDRV